jgi:hypothetical protein
MMLPLATPDQERCEAKHYRRLASSASHPELARIAGKLADVCERKAALLQKVEHESKKIPPFPQTKP